MSKPQKQADESKPELVTWLQFEMDDLDSPQEEASPPHPAPSAPPLDGDSQTGAATGDEEEEKRLAIERDEKARIKLREANEERKQELREERKQE